MKEKMEVELHHRLDSRELLLNQKETDLTALQVLVVQYILSFVPVNSYFAWLQYLTSFSYYKSS